MLAGRPRVLTAVVAMLASRRVSRRRVGRVVQLRPHRRPAQSPRAQRHSATWRRRRRSSTRRTSRPSPSSRNSGSRCRSAKISPNLIKAVISVEDQRFYEHSGVDVVRVAGGGRCRTSQDGPPRRRRQHHHAAARAAELPHAATRRYRRKLKEVILAAYIEQMYTKNEILEMYLNKVYFGDGLYGVEAASRGYFGKPASDLTRRRSGAARRPDPVAVELRADRQPRPRDRAAQRRAAGDGRRRRDRSADRGARAKRRPVKLVNGLEIRGVVRPVLQGTGAARARRALRLAARVPGRAARLHDDRPRAAARRRSARREGAVGRSSGGAGSSTRARGRQRR